MNPPKTQKKIRRCAWCPKLAQAGRVAQCPKCRGYFCTPELRDCMTVHWCGKKP